MSSKLNDFMVKCTVGSLFNSELLVGLYRIAGLYYSAEYE